MARRHSDLPETHGALEARELSEDQVAVICRHAPAAIDSEVAELARSTTVTQLGRILGPYAFEEPAEPSPAQEAGPPRRPASAAKPRRVSFFYTDDGSWRLSAQLPADEGAVWERALTDVRDELFRAGEHGSGPGASPADVSWADAFVAVAEKSSAAGTVNPPHRDRPMVLLHLPAGGRGHLHLGPGVSDGLRRFLSCDSRLRAVFEADGKPVSVGRAFRIVPDRTRIVIEDRDRGCRVPGCDRSRWLHVHRLTHWEDGGTADTANLIALCQHHHRLHHRGGLGIGGNADEPDGVVFTDELGRRLESCGRPIPPGNRPPPPGNWTPPSGERLEPWPIHFNEPRPAVA